MFDIANNCIADFIDSFLFALLFIQNFHCRTFAEADCPKRSYGCRAAAHKHVLEIRQLPLRKEEETSATVVTVAPHDGIMKTHLFSRPSLSLFYRWILSRCRGQLRRYSTLMLCNSNRWLLYHFRFPLLTPLSTCGCC